MTNYPYYIAVCYDAGILRKIRFDGVVGKKFNNWADCAVAIRHHYKKFPDSKNNQILILEYIGQYESKIIDICKGDEWISIDSPTKLMQL